MPLFLRIACWTFRLNQPSAALPTQADSSTSPSHIVRMLMVYGRNGCKPQHKDQTVSWTECQLIAFGFNLSMLQAFRGLMNSPYFFLDCFYVHEPVTPDNRCEVCMTDAKVVPNNNCIWQCPSLFRRSTSSSTSSTWKIIRTYLKFHEIQRSCSTAWHNFWRTRFSDNLKTCSLTQSKMQSGKLNFSW